GSGSPPPAIENRLRYRASDRPQKALPTPKISERVAFESEQSIERHRWKVCGLGDADLFVRLGDATLRRRDVRPSLQKLRRETHRDIRRLEVQWRGRQAEVRGRLSDQ